MNDYIKRDDAIENIDELYFSDKDDHDRTREAIKRLSAADVAEVVRCKDCKYWNNETDLTYCEKKLWLGTDATDYCSFGERAES